MHLLTFLLLRIVGVSEGLKIFVKLHSVNCICENNYDNLLIFCAYAHALLTGICKIKPAVLRIAVRRAIGLFIIKAGFIDMRACGMLHTANYRRNSA